MAFGGHMGHGKPHGPGCSRTSTCPAAARLMHGHQLVLRWHLRTRILLYSARQHRPGLSIWAPVIAQTMDIQAMGINMSIHINFRHQHSLGGSMDHGHQHMPGCSMEHRYQDGLSRGSKEPGGLSRRPNAANELLSISGIQSLLRES